MGRKPFPSFRISLALAMPLLAGLAGCAGDVSPLQRAGIAGNEDARDHALTPATISSTLPASMRPMTSPSSIAEGEQAQSPRQ